MSFFFHASINIIKYLVSIINTYFFLSTLIIHYKEKLINTLKTLVYDILVFLEKIYEKRKKKLIFLHLCMFLIKIVSKLFSPCTCSLREPKVPPPLFLIGGLICSCGFWIVGLMD